MTLIIETPKSDVDFLRMAEIRAQAFGSDYEKVLIHFPRLSTPEGQAMLRDRMIKMQKDLRSVRFAVVRDTETGEIISQAQWHFYEKDDKGDILVLDFLEGSEEEKEYGRYLMGTFQAKRRQAIEQTKVPLMCMFDFIQNPFTLNSSVFQTHSFQTLSFYQDLVRNIYIYKSNRILTYLHSTKQPSDGSSPPTPWCRDNVGEMGSRNSRRSRRRGT